MASSPSWRMISSASKSCDSAELGQAFLSLGRKLGSKPRVVEHDDDRGVIVHGWRMPAGAEARECHQVAAGGPFGPAALTLAVAGLAPTPLDCTESPHRSGVAMESRRRVVAGLTVAAVALIVAGVAALAIDSESASGPSTASGTLPGTQPNSYSFGTPSPSATAPTPSGSPGQTPSEVSSSPSARADALRPHDRLRDARGVDRLLHGRRNGRADGAGPGPAHGSRRRPGAVLRPVTQPLRSSGGLLCRRVHAERHHAAG